MPPSDSKQQTDDERRQGAFDQLAHGHGCRKVLSSEPQRNAKSDHISDQVAGASSARSKVLDRNVGEDNC